MGTLSAGTRIGAYEIVAPLGAGGMGEVYRARDPRLGREVALKILPREMAADPSRLERFAREAQALAALNHPHIVTIYSNEEAEGVRFLTMELVEGETLDRHIAPGGLPLERFFAVALALADALSAAHQKNITHRDLKPANVMLTVDDRVKVLDFGLARIAPQEREGLVGTVTHATLTLEGTIIGTVPYMSPEQIEGRPLDPRSDLFSFGVVLYEMVTGARPFTGDTSAMLMSSILKDTPRGIADARRDAPAALARLIARCLEKRPQDRVQTARDVFNELRHIHKDLESSATRRPDSGIGTARFAEAVSIAVLPFTTQGGASDAETIAEGLTDDISAGLARFKYLSVVARQSTRQFKGAVSDVRLMGEQLGARYLLEGSVRATTAEIRVTVQLIDAGRGAQLWSETYKREASDVLAVQDHVTDRVVATVADVYGVLMRSMLESLRGRKIEDLTAPELALRYWGLQRAHTPEDHGRLRDAFEQLVAREPNRPDAWASLAYLYCYEHMFLYNPRPDPLLRAHQAVARAMDLDPADQHAWEALAVTYFLERDRDGFLHAAERAMSLNPRNTNTAAWMGNRFSLMAEFADRGCEVTERAMKLNPDHPGWYYFAFVNRHYGRREFAEALQAAKKINMPDQIWSHLAIATACGQLGRIQEAQSAARAFLAAAPPLADERVLREVLRRWAWDEEGVELLLEGWRRASPQPQTTGAPAARRLDSGSARSAESISIAVLPFAVHGGRSDTEGIAEGLTDDITAGLSRFKYLSVVAPQSTRQFKGAVSDVRLVGEQLGARYLLEGTVRATAAEVRVTVQLIDAARGAQLWSEIYKSDLQASDPLAIQDDVTDRVVATVADVYGVLMRSMLESLHDRPIEDLAPHELALRYWGYQRRHTPDEHRRLRDAFEKLVAQEPNRADAWASLGYLYCNEYMFLYDERPDPLARARQAATRALDLEATNQHAWELLACIYFLEHDRDGLLHAAERAMSLNPRNTNSVAYMATLFSHIGDLADRGCEITERAMNLNPDHPGWYHFAFFNRHYRKHEFAEALRAAKKINMPDHVWSHFVVALAAGQLGRIQEAQAAARAFLKIAPGLADERALREATRRWKWDEDEVDLMMEGWRKATSTAADPSSSGAAAPRSLTSSAPSVSGGMRADATSIAVLPFTCRTADEESSALADGLTEDITAGLSRFSYLRVVAHAAAERLKGEVLDARAASAQLGARYLLEGSIRKAGATVRVGVRLVDADSGTHLWAENFDRDLAAGTFTLQDEIAGRVVATVADENGMLIRSMAGTVMGKPLEAMTVAELVLRFFAYTDHMRPEEHAVLRSGFERALEREPRHADGWACLAWLYEHELTLGMNLLPASLERCRQAAQRAIEADPLCQAGWRALGSAHFMGRDRAGLHAATERVLALNPLNTTAVAFCGMLLAFAGDWDRGATIVRRAMALNPNHARWALFVPVLDHYRQGEYAESLLEAKRINMPLFPMAHMTLAAVAGQLGSRGDAAGALEALGNIKPALLDLDAARRGWATMLWEEGLQDQLVDGFRKAQALAAGAAVSKSGAERRPSIAILPFSDLSPAKDQDWFCDGIAEEILNALAQLKGLHVAARTSAFSFRGRGDDLKTIGDKLAVATVLEGSVRRSGERVRITVQLVDVADGFQIWSERYDRDLKDIFDVQDEIARAVAERLRLTLAGDPGNRLVAQRTANTKAYDLYLQGRALLYRRGTSTLPALEQFRKAVELDPDFALAWAGVADAYTVLAYFGLIRGAEAKLQGLTAARRAIELDPRSAEAHTSLACATLLYENDHQTAKEEFLLALALNPQYVQGRCWYALFYLQWARGEFEEGIAEAHRALDSDPLSAYVTVLLAIALGTAGRHEEAIAQGRLAVERDPESFLARWGLGSVLQWAGRFEDAVAVLEEAAAMSDRNLFAVAGLAASFAGWGKPAQARAMHQELLDRSSRGYVPFTHLALSAVAVDAEAAITFARRAWTEREPPFILFARHNLGFRPLHADPRFASILRELDAPV